MTILKSWGDALPYVNRLGIASKSLPIGWRQEVLMANVDLIDGKTCDTYPIGIRFNRKQDTFTIQDKGEVKTIRK